jgi:hypothetical protein
MTIFWPGSALHDMGVIISQGRLAAAAVQFPLTESTDLDSSMGSRHRSAIGLSQETDAVVLVVSEETGTISVVIQGKMQRFLTPETLRQDVRGKQTRQGFPSLHGPDIMPGPEDTFISYGKAWANVSDTPFREYKHWVHEGGIATPLIAHWPGRIQARGALRHQPGHLIDIMATCLEVAGARYPARFNGTKITPSEGRSLVPAFDNRPIKRDGLFWEHEGNRAVRDGKWKLVAKSPAGRWELYDLTAAAPVYTIVNGGVTVMAGGGAGVDSFTITAGDILLTAGNQDMTLGDLHFQDMLT